MECVVEHIVQDSSICYLQVEYQLWEEIKLQKFSLKLRKMHLQQKEKQTLIQLNNRKKKNLDIELSIIANHMLIIAQLGFGTMELFNQKI